MKNKGLGLAWISVVRSGWIASLALCAAAHAALPDETFTQMVASFRSHPEDKALQARIVRAARDQTPTPAIPEEARRFFIRGNTALEDARSQEGYLRAIRNYGEALKIAPWWAEAYRNLGKAREAARDYAGAIDALELYLLTGPSQPAAREVQDHIYALEERQEASRDQRDAAALAPPGAMPESTVKDTSQEIASKPGGVFRDCSECPDMVVVDSNDAMGKYPVTQKQWRALMGSNPSHFEDCGGDCPVENVSWDDAQAYVAKLNAKTHKAYALPTEAQWEAACHAASQTEYCGGDTFEAFAWFLRNSGAKTHPVGQKQPSGPGLYDMNGNVWQWTSDCSNSDCRYRILRGGSWSFDPQFAGSRKRIGIATTNRLSDYGFRVVRALP